jgi:hypothetical protein
VWSKLRPIDGTQVEACATTPHLNRAVTLAAKVAGNPTEFL